MKFRYLHTEPFDTVSVKVFFVRQGKRTLEFLGALVFDSQTFALFKQATENSMNEFEIDLATIEVDASNTTCLDEYIGKSIL